MRFAIATLGCKVNQYDSAIIESRLGARGFERREFDEFDARYLRVGGVGVDIGADIAMCASKTLGARRGEASLPRLEGAWTDARKSAKGS